MMKKVMGVARGDAVLDGPVRAVLVWQEVGIIAILRAMAAKNRFMSPPR